MHVIDKEKHCGRYMDKFLCRDDQHPSESSVNIVFQKYELNMRNCLWSDDVISAFAVYTRQVLTLGAHAQRGLQ